MVYDICNQKTYDDIETFWLGEVEKYAEKGVTLLLLGNKLDQAAENREVHEKMAETLAHRVKGKMLSYEVSAKDNNNVTEAFETTCRELMRLKE